MNVSLTLNNGCRRNKPVILFMINLMKEVKLMGEKIEIISTVTVDHSKDLYKIVDALNRSLKRDDLMFGLALDQNDQSKAVFTIYRT